MKYTVAMLLFSCVVLPAQSLDSTHNGKLQIRWVQAQIGGSYNVGDFKFQIQDFRNLAPESKLLQNDFNGYERNNGYYYFSPGIFAVSVDIGLQRNNAKKRKLDYLFGIGYMHDIMIGAAISKKSKVFDDIYVNAEGAQVAHFKEAKDTYTMIYNANMVNVKAATYYHTSKDKNLYFGIGVEASAGLLVGANTSVRFNTDTLEGYRSYGIDYYNNQYRSYSPRDYAKRYRQEDFSNKLGWTAALGLPITATLHHMRFKVLRNIRPYYEFKPIYRAFNVPELYTVGFLRVQHSFGIKVEW